MEEHNFFRDKVFPCSPDSPRILDQADIELTEIHTASDSWCLGLMVCGNMPDLKKTFLKVWVRLEQ